MRLIGYVDGEEVKLDFFPPNTFRGEIPAKPKGQYIVELHAIDDAGNITNYAHVFVMINFDALTIELLSPNFKDAEYDHSYSEIQEKEQYTSRILDTSSYSTVELNNLSFITHELGSNYVYRELIL